MCKAWNYIGQSVPEYPGLATFLPTLFFIFSQLILPVHIPSFQTSYFLNVWPFLLLWSDLSGSTQRGFADWKSLYKKVTFSFVKQFWFQTEQPRDVCHAPQKHFSDSSDPCGAAHSKKKKKKRATVRGWIWSLKVSCPSSRKALIEINQNGWCF